MSFCPECWCFVEEPDVGEQTTIGDQLCEECRGDDEDSD